MFGKGLKYYIYPIAGIKEETETVEQASDQKVDEGNKEPTKEEENEEEEEDTDSDEDTGFCKYCKMNFPSAKVNT